MKIWVEADAPGTTLQFPTVVDRLRCNWTLHPSRSNMLVSRGRRQLVDARTLRHMSAQLDRAKMEAGALFGPTRASRLPILGLLAQALLRRRLAAAMPQEPQRLRLLQQHAAGAPEHQHQGPHPCTSVPSLAINASPLPRENFIQHSRAGPGHASRLPPSRSPPIRAGQDQRRRRGSTPTEQCLVSDEGLVDRKAVATAAEMAAVANNAAAGGRYRASSLGVAGGRGRYA